MEQNRKQLKENIEFFTKTDPVGRIVYEILGHV
jgi:hypothetical protein